MFSSKLNRAGKASPDIATRDKKPISAETNQPTRVNPVWHSLATSIGGHAAAGSSRRLSPIQPKLTVGEPDDEYEKEADQVADRVMRMPGNTQQIDKTPDIQASRIQTPVIQRALIPQAEIEPPAPTPIPAPPSVAIQMLQHIIDGVERACAVVERTPSRYEPDLLLVLLNENEPPHRTANTTINFFSHGFPDVYQLLTDDFRRQVNMEIQDPIRGEEEYNAEITDAVFHRYLIPIAYDYHDANPQFRRRLELERQRRQRRRYRPMQPGEERA